jgi:hypothetical protein
VGGTHVRMWCMRDCQSSDNLIHCADKMLKEANMGLINGLFEVVYVNGEFIVVALVWRHHTLTQGLFTTYIFLVCLYLSDHHD